MPDSSSTPVCCENNYSSKILPLLHTAFFEQNPDGNCRATRRRQLLSSHDRIESRMVIGRQGARSINLYAMIPRYTKVTNRQLKMQRIRTAISGRAAMDEGRTNKSLTHTLSNITFPTGRLVGGSSSLCENSLCKFERGWILN